MPLASGQFTRDNSVNTGADTWKDDRDAPVNILASRMDYHDNDVATALSTALYKDGQQTATANQPMGGNKHINVGNGSSRTDYARVDNVQDGDYAWGGTAGGSSSAYTVTLSPAITAYAAGMVVNFLANHTSEAGGTTLNVNGVGAKNILKDSALSALEADDIKTNDIVSVIYDSGGGGRWLLMKHPNKAGFDTVYLVDVGSNKIVVTNSNQALVSMTGTSFRTKIKATASFGEVSWTSSPVVSNQSSAWSTITTSVISGMTSDEALEITAYPRVSVNTNDGHSKLRVRLTDSNASHNGQASSFFAFGAGNTNGLAATGVAGAVADGFSGDTTVTIQFARESANAHINYSAQGYFLWKRIRTGS